MSDYDEDEWYDEDDDDFDRDDWGDEDDSPEYPDDTISVGGSIWDDIERRAALADENADDQPLDDDDIPW